MRGVLELAFGAAAQIVMGVAFFIATAVQTYYWTVVTPPTVAAVFLVSMEALFFTSFGVIATGLGYRKTEHVETAVVQNIDTAENVEVNGKEE